MIICNGKIRFALCGTSAVNALGEPVAGEAGWGAWIACRIETTTDTRKGVYEDGKYRHAEFMVLIDHHHHRLPSSVRVELERLGEPLGAYDVISVTPLEAVHALKLMVAK